MIRVAKKRSKISIAAETHDFIDKQYKTGTLSKKYFEGQTFELAKMKNAFPMKLLKNDRTFMGTTNFIAQHSSK
jgi:hypothetical protein